MNWWQAIILGIVQGLTEFLPVSSSGHLILVQNLMGVQEENALFFFVMLHLATVLAICVALTKSVFSLVKLPIPKKAWRIVIATVPGVIAGFAFKLLVDRVPAIDNFLNGSLLWVMFLITASLLFVTELLSKRRALTVPIALKTDSSESIDANTPNVATSKGAESIATDADKQKKKRRFLPDEDGEITLRQALFIGCAQAVAILPGISRSGSTICAGVLQGADRKKVADFSFLMSIPIILGGAILELLDVESFASINVFHLALGMCAAFISGYLAISLMLRLIAKANYKWFSLYLVVLSIVTLILSLTNII